MTAATADSAQFGKLLKWHRDPARGCWTVSHAGREASIVRLDRWQARDRARGGRPGWWLEYDGQPGPRVGAALPAAKALTELWLLTCDTDHRDAERAPSVLLAMGSSGAVFSSPAGSTLIARFGPDGIIRIDVDRYLIPVGRIRPAATVHEGTVTITWHPHKPDGTPAGEPCATFYDAVRAVTAPPSGAASRAGNEAR